MSKSRKRRRILAQAGLILSLLAVAVRAGAQTSQFDEEIAKLSGLIDDFEKGRTMIITSHPPSKDGWMVVFERERVGDVAGWMVLSGKLHPDSAQSWTREQLALSQGALAVWKKQLAELEAKRVAPPTTATPTTAAPPPEAMFWPTPMEWTKTRGTVRGTFLAECRGLRKEGLFGLVLVGDGTVRGSFAPGYRVEGTILPDGTASGKSLLVVPDPGEPGFFWAVRFSRSGNQLLMSSNKLDLLAGQGGILTGCKPGYLRQEESWTEPSSQVRNWSGSPTR